MTELVIPDAGADTEINSDLLYMRVARLVFNQPLLVTPDVAETIGTFIRSRMDGARPESNRFVGRPVIDAHSGRWMGYRREGSVGVVSIMGELVNRGAWLGASSGLTSYEGIVEQFRAAANDPAVGDTIVADINSPGGEAYGMADTAREIRSIAHAAGKRIVAVINSVGASAAYGLASAADEIVVTESGIAGSIGVVMVHYDYSERVSKMGVKATVITAGKSKATGHPFAPLGEEDRAHLQAKVERIMDGFVKLVTDHRESLSEESVRGQEANTFIGEDAVAAGLADRVGTFADVIKQLSSARSGRASLVQNRRPSMDTNDQPAPEANAGIPKAQHDAAVTTARQEGEAAGHAKGLEEGKAQGATEATARIAAILDHENAKGREQLSRHLAFKTGMSADDAAAALAAAPVEKKGSSLSQEMNNQPGTSLGAPPSGSEPATTVDKYERGRQIALKATGKAAA